MSISDHVYINANLVLRIAAVGIVLRWPQVRGRALVLGFLGLDMAGAAFFYALGLVRFAWWAGWHDFAITAGRITSLLSNVVMVWWLIAFKGAAEAQLPPPPALPGWNPDSIPAAERRSILQRREWACVLDFVLINTLAYAISFMAAEDSGEYRQFRPGAWIAGFVLSSFCVLLKDAFAGSGFGKAMTHLRVVDIRTGAPIGPLKSVLRNWILILPLFPLLELVVALRRRDRRRLGDLMAGTIVIRERPASSKT